MSSKNSFFPYESPDDYLLNSNEALPPLFFEAVNSQENSSFTPPEALRFEKTDIHPKKFFLRCQRLECFGILYFFRLKIFF